MRFTQVLSFLIITVLLAGLSCRTEGQGHDIPFSDGMGYVNSINGEVIYYFDATTLALRMLLSLKNHKNGYYMVRLKNDTLEIGEEFIGEVIFMREGILDLNNPYDTLFKGGSYYKARLIPSGLGTYDFSGKLKFDSGEFPFSYKFIVVGKGQRKNKFVFTKKIQGGRHSDH